MLIFQRILPTWQLPHRLQALKVSYQLTTSHILLMIVSTRRQQAAMCAACAVLACPNSSASAFTAIQPNRHSASWVGTPSRVRPRTSHQLECDATIHTKHASNPRHVSSTELSALSLPSSFSLPSPSSPLIAATDDMGNASAVLMCATIAQFLGKSTAIGRLLGPPVTAMALTFLLATIGIMPPGGSAGATALQGMTLSLATPLLLLGADIKSAKSSCGPLLISFILA